MIGIVNYGLGNVRAFKRAFDQLEVASSIVSEPNELKNLSKILLPGVGSFDNAMGRLCSSGMTEELTRLALVQRIPILGVCVGMQIFANGSDEGNANGLGWIPGWVKKFSNLGFDSKLPTPHMGWNSVSWDMNSESIFKKIDQGTEFYFLHSFFFDSLTPGVAKGWCQYGHEFEAVVVQDNIVGVQFHPEKSHKAGLQLLRNFSEFN